MPATVVAVAVAVLHEVKKSVEVAVVVADAAAVAVVVDGDAGHSVTSNRECFALPMERMTTQWD